MTADPSIHQHEQLRRTQMGMDVIGQDPTSKAGKYFARNWWGWTPLAEMACTLCPKEAAGCRGWYYNDGDGLDSAEASALAEALRVKLTEGAVGAYIKLR